MGDVFQERVRAMRTRLSHLSDNVEQQEEERLLQRRAMTHRYVAEATGSLGIPRAETSPAEPSAAGGLSTRSAGLRARDVNRMPVESHKPAAHRAGVDVSRRAAAPVTSAKPATGVSTMLQLARQHAGPSLAAPSPSALATTTTTTEPLLSTTRPPTPHHAEPATRPTAAAVKQERTPAMLHTPAMPAGAAGLHSYSFQERFPPPRRHAEAPAETHGRTPYRHQVPDEGSAQESAVVDAPGLESETAFDAFRVVQERLRLKMKQLTTTSLQSTLWVPEDESHHESGDGAVAAAPPARAYPDYVHAAYEDVEDLSPPPRRPPGTRAETATPTRSPDDAEVHDDENNSDHTSRGSTTAPPPRAPALRTSSGCGEVAQPAATVGGAAAASRPAEMAACAGLYSSDSGDDHDAACDGSEGPTQARERAPPHYAGSGAPSRGSFSDPTLSQRLVAPLTASATAGVCGGAAERRSGSWESWRQPERTSARRAARPTLSAGGHSLRGAAAHGRSAAGEVWGRCRSRPASSSVSAPRSSSAREGSKGSTVGQSHSSTQKGAATRPRPISLNVEATVLCAVTGAELFALLRMRGLVESEGDTEEYRLPPARCHRLYVTAEEHRQLLLLRQSLHSMAEEEHRHRGPSYQRATLSARSRNAEFAAPPPVSRYLDTA